MSAQLPDDLARRRDEMLQHATTRGTRLRRRRHAAVAGAVVIAASAVAGSLAAFGASDRTARVATSVPDTSTSEATTTSTADATSTTIAESTTTIVVTPVSVSTSTLYVSSTSDTTVLVCHDSYDPRCGPLMFTSTPVNQPLVLSVDPTVTGSVVHLHIRASDDAAVDPCMHVEWGDGGISIGPDRFGCVAMGSCVMPRDRYGPWDPPPPTPETVTLDFSHAFTSTGTMKITIDADSAVPCSPDQFYASTATYTHDVTITEAATTATTSTTTP